MQTLNHNTPPVVTYKTQYLWVLALLTALVAAGHLRHWLHSIPTDLGAFYAGGKVVLAHHDPYLLQPLLQTQQELAPLEKLPNTVTPVPLPSYVLVLFSLLACLPIHAAVLSVGILLLISTAVLGYSLWRLSPLPLPLALCVAFFGALYTGSELGQIAPIAIAALTLAVLFLRNNNPLAAGIATSVTLLQPQFGIPVVFSALIFIPQIRIALLSCCLTLTIIGLSLGIAINTEYLQVLRLQARSEVEWPAQFSLTWLAHALGANTTLALALGAASTILTVSITFLIIAFNRDAAKKNGAVLLLPAASAVLGGSFIHSYQLAAALPAAIILIRPQKSWFNPAVGAALFIIPFSMASEAHSHHLSLQTLSVTIIAVITAWTLLFYLHANNTTQRERALQATLYTMGLTAVFILIVKFHPISIMHLENYHNSFPSTIFSSLAWQDMIEFLSRSIPYSPFYIIDKLPLWCAVFITVFFSAHALFREQRTAIEKNPCSLNTSSNLS